MSKESQIFDAFNTARAEVAAPVAEFRIVPNFVSGGWMVILSSSFEVNAAKVDVILARRGIAADFTDEALALSAKETVAAAQRKVNFLSSCGFRLVRRVRTAA